MTDQEIKECKDIAVNLKKFGIDTDRSYTQREKELIKQNLDDFSNLIDILYFIKNNF